MHSGRTKGDWGWSIGRFVLQPMKGSTCAKFEAEDLGSLSPMTYRLALILFLALPLAVDRR
jgi:hypothetical protein